MNSNKTYTDAPASSVGWVYSNSSNTYMLDVLVGSGQAGPAHTIIGLPADDNKYDAANASSKGNGPHNPFLANSATFTIDFTGRISANSRPSQAWFQFGTEDSNFVKGSTTSPVPEPATPLMLGSGVVGLSGLLRRKLFR